MRRLVFIIMCAAIAMTAAASNDDIKLWSDGPLNWSDFHQLLPPTSSEPSRLEVELSATPLESGDRVRLEARAIMHRNSSATSAAQSTPERLRYHQLQFDLLEVVEIDVCIAERVNKIAALETCHLRHHLEQKGIRSDIKRHAKEDIRATLIELQTQFTVRHIELKQAMTGRQSHLLHFRHIPCTHHHPAAVGVFLNHLHDIGNLVYRTAVVIRPRSPLMSIDRTQLAVLVSPFVPNTHTVFLQILHVRIALKEPQQFIYNRFQMQFLGGQERKTVLHLKAHLMSENRDRSCSRPVMFHRAFLQHSFTQI